MAQRAFSIGRRQLGDGAPAFLIAEAGVNHDGDEAKAIELVRVAARAGADAVKFQTFNADRLVTKSARKAQYQTAATSQDESQYAMLKRLELSRPAHERLKRLCDSLGIEFLSTPFDEECAEFLAELGMVAFKTPSGELTNLPYLESVAQHRLPMIISTGMANLAEVETALDTVASVGNDRLAVLHCVSNYPAPVEDANLRAMATIEKAFDVPVGYSDHTLGIEVSVAAVALGARVIEKHFTLDKTAAGPDHRASLEPDELAAMVQAIRHVEAALGDGRKRPTESERDTAEVARKSLVAARDLPAGTRLEPHCIAIKRPGTGLPPSMRTFLIHRVLRQDVPEGTLLTLDMVA